MAGPAATGKTCLIERFVWELEKQLRVEIMS